MKMGKNFACYFHSNEFEESMKRLKSEGTKLFIFNNKAKVNSKLAKWIEKWLGYKCCCMDSPHKSSNDSSEVLANNFNTEHDIFICTSYVGTGVNVLVERAAFIINGNNFTAQQWAQIVNRSRNDMKEPEIAIVFRYRHHYAPEYGLSEGHSVTIEREWNVEAYCGDENIARCYNDISSAVREEKASSRYTVDWDDEKKPNIGFNAKDIEDCKHYGLLVGVEDTCYFDYECERKYDSEKRHEQHEKSYNPEKRHEQHERSYNPEKRHEQHENGKEIDVLGCAAELLSYVGIRDTIQYPDTLHGSDVLKEMDGSHRCCCCRTCY
ncbi:MAG: hypothetical protein HUJ76_13160, partial [Parasporobacterium sp.]|nr:hypothetical protein [Parasporobacterium sp.]